MTSKLEDGNLRARIICSNDMPAVPSAVGLAKLWEKHPQSSLNSSDLVDPGGFLPLEVEEKDLLKAVRSFFQGQLQAQMVSVRNT